MQMLEQKYRLAVSFDEKDRVKVLGAKWDPVERVWWTTLRNLDDRPSLGQWLPPGSLRDKCLTAAAWLREHGDSELAPIELPRRAWSGADLATSPAKRR